MSLTLHTIKPAAGSRTKTFRIGRGNASGRGTTAGRGTKGQRARTGGRKNLKLKGIKQMLLSFPKLRGFQSRYEKSAVVSLEVLAKNFQAGDKINLAALKEKHLISKSADSAKIVGTISLDKALVLDHVLATASAKAAIEKAGGKAGAKPRSKQRNKKS